MVFTPITMHKLHYGLTVAVPLKEKKWGELRTVLKSINEVSKTNPSVFSRSETTLFASGAIIPKQQNQDGEWLPETLVFTTAYYGPRSVHIRDLVDTCFSSLCDIFRFCVGFADSNIPSKEELITFINKHSQRGAYNSRYNCITKSEVEEEKQLRKEIQTYLDRVQNLIPLNELSGLQIKQLIERHLIVQGEKFEWTMKSVRKNVLEQLATNRGGLLIFIVVVLFAVDLGIALHMHAWKNLLIGGAAGAIIALLGYTLIWHITRCPNETACRPNDRRARRMASTQLRPILNEMIAAAPLKRGKTRRFFYHYALRVVNFLAGTFMNVPTVSNIRWLAIDGRKRLLFTSIYSNTTDFYVREFLTGDTPRGVNFMFTHGMGFPDAQYLFKGGIREDPEGYMNAVHSGQHLTDLFYAHEKDLTAEIICQNRKMRNGLFQPMTEQEAAIWLKMI